MSTLQSRNRAPDDLDNFKKNQKNKDFRTIISGLASRLFIRAKRIETSGQYSSDVLDGHSRGRTALTLKRNLRKGFN